MDKFQKEIDERTNLTGSNKFELLLFRLGGDANGEHSELFGINVFKIREIVAMTEVKINTPAGTTSPMLGVVNIRGQIISVIDLPAVVNCIPRDGLKILLVTEYARSTQAFAVESVEEIVRLEWSDVLSAESSAGGNIVTSIARLGKKDGETDDNAPTRLAQVLDVEQILHQISPTDRDFKVASLSELIDEAIKPGAVVIAADDSGVARKLIERGLTELKLDYEMYKTGKDAWERVQQLSQQAREAKVPISDKISFVLTDLEMPEMDGFTFTRNIKREDFLKNLPVIIHSSLTGTANEDHVRKVGADAYVAKFDITEMGETIGSILRGMIAANKRS